MASPFGMADTPKRQTPQRSGARPRPSPRLESVKRVSAPATPILPSSAHQVRVLGTTARTKPTNPPRRANLKSPTLITAESEPGASKDGISDIQAWVKGIVSDSSVPPSSVVPPSRTTISQTNAFVIDGIEREGWEVLTQEPEEEENHVSGISYSVAERIRTN